MRKYSVAWSLAAVVVTFVGLFLMFGSAGVLLQLLVPAVASLGVGAGVQVMLTRTASEITADTYDKEVEEKLADIDRLLAALDWEAKHVRNPNMSRSLMEATKLIPDLLHKVKKHAPRSVYSTASKLQGHLSSLADVAAHYREVEHAPAYYEDAPALLAAGEEAAARFVAHHLDHIRMLGKGELSRYNTSIDTVAPPSMPDLPSGH